MFVNCMKWEWFLVVTASKLDRTCIKPFKSPGNFFWQNETCTTTTLKKNWYS